jgi:hypothetical protein
MSKISYSVHIEINNVDFVEIDNDKIEQSHQNLKENIIKILTTRLVKRVGDIKIVYDNSGFNIQIDNLDFVEIDNDKIEQYRKSLKENIIKSLNTRYISNVGDIKIDFYKI